MSNKIQIKRSTTNATIPALSNGELAFTGNGSVLYIGKPDGTGNLRIGGEQVPGTLTANQALVANSTSGIDKVITANLSVEKVTANGSQGTAGYVLASGASGNVYWLDPGTLSTSAAGANTYIQFNDSGVFGAQANLTFNKDTATLSATNFSGNGAGVTSVDAVTLGGKSEGDLNVNSASSALNANNATYLNTKSEGDLNVNNAVTADTANNATYAFGKSESDLNVNSASSALNANNATYLNTKSEGDLNVNNAVTSDTANNATYAFGKSEGDLNVNNAVTANSSTYLNGKSEGDLNVNNAVTSDTANNATYAFGKSEGDLNVNSASSSLNSNNASYLNGNTVGDIVTSAVANTESHDNTFTGNNIFQGSNVNISSFLTTANADLASIKVRTSSLIGGSYDRNEVNLSAGDKLTIAGGNYGIDLLASNNGTDWFTLTLSGNTGELRAPANINATSYSIDSSLTANSTKISFTGANIDATSATLRVQDATVSGNLTVSGTVSFINTQQLVVNDNIIELASNNNGSATFSDAVDTGLFVPTGNTLISFYSGLARIASASSNTNPYFRLFSTDTNPNTSITIPGTITSGTLQAYLAPYGTSGALIANATNIAITANSTVNVAFQANTLTLTTALAATSGGTGHNTYSSGDLLVANTGNVLSVLPLSSTAGYILQSNGTALVYDVLDGGSF